MDEHELDAEYPEPESWRDLGACALFVGGVCLAVSLFYLLMPLR